MHEEISNLKYRIVNFQTSDAKMNGLIKIDHDLPVLILTL